MAARDLPEIYTQSLRATGPRAEGVYFRQISNRHGVTDIFNLKVTLEPCIECYTTRKHERRAAPILTPVMHNISRPYWHKLIKQRNLLIVIHSLAK